MCHVVGTPARGAALYARIKEDTPTIGYEISFTRHFYNPQLLRSRDETRKDMIAVEKEAEGLLDVLLAGAKA